MVSHKARGGAAGAFSRSASEKPQASQQQNSAEEENDSAESYSTKFKHLLEPIRDLAENWNVDIARDLEQYLADLEMLEISLDGGVTTLNFAEAALLIQGSTCVYSRKVEYLHKLVFHVLEVLCDSQQQQNNGNRASENADGEDPEGSFPREPDFIALDDIPEAKSTQIDLVEKDDNMEDDRPGAGSAFNRSPQLLMMSLEADPDSTDPNKDLRLHSAVMHSSGALLLEPKFQHLLDRNLQPLRPGARTPLLSPRSACSAVSSAEVARAEASPSSRPDALAAAPADPASPLRMILEFEPEQGGMDAADSDDGDDLDAHQPPEEEQGGGGAAAAAVDVWEMLDPHDGGGSRERPFRRGRTHRQPRRAEGGGKRGGKGAGSGGEVWGHQRRSLKVPYFADMAPAFLAERNRVLAARMAQARAEGRAGRPGSAAGVGSGFGGGGAGVQFQGVDMEDDYDEVDVQVEGGGDGGALDDSDDDGGPLPEVEVGEAGEGGWGGAGGLGQRGLGGGGWGDGVSYEEACKAHIAECMRGVENYLQESGLEGRVREWRQRIEPRLAEEAARAHFDIHEYGAEVKRRLSAASTPQRKVAFATAVQGMTQPDVCRTFLAALQLANDGNLDIHLQDPGDRSSVALELLECNESTHALLGSYVAPSILSAQKKTRRSPRSPAAKRLRNAPRSLPADAENAAEEEEEEAAAGPSVGLARLQASSPLRPLNYAAADDAAGTSELQVTTSQLSQSLTQDKAAPARSDKERGAFQAASAGARGRAR